MEISCAATTALDDSVYRDADPPDGVSCGRILFVNAMPGLARSLSDAFADDVEAAFCSFDDLSFSLETGRVSIRADVVGADLSEFGLVVFSSLGGCAVMMGGITAYLRHHRVPFQSEVAIGVNIPTKLVQYVRFVLAGLAVPRSRFLAKPILAGAYDRLADELSLPFIVKAVNSSAGRNNWLVTGRADFDRCLETVAADGISVIAQRFIPNDGDLRVLVLGGRVAVVLHRTAQPGSHLNNTSRGGHAVLTDPATLDPAAANLALRGAQVARADVAGVDVVRDRETGEWYLLEANIAPAIASGSFTAEKIAAYTEYLRACVSADRPS